MVNAKRTHKRTQTSPARFKPWSSDPTPEEIAEACRRIRATWTDREHVKRAHGEQPDPYEVPHLVFLPLRSSGRVD